MPLATNVNVDKLIHRSSEHGKLNVHSLFVQSGGSSNTHSQNPRANDYSDRPIPKYAIPSHGISAEAAYELIHNELTLDGIPLLNLASFVHTHVAPEGEKLAAENVGKNLIDSDEYPATTAIHARCVSMIAKLWHADGEKEKATGTATTGSSEAIQLAGLAMKKQWQERRIAAGKDHYHPNIVMGANAQVALEKFARYFDVEARLIPVTEKSNYCLDTDRIHEFVDENTIGVFVILGSTYTGHYEDVVGVAKVLDEYEAKTGISIPIHVDAASGGFVAPFVSPSLTWDFKVKRVVSINSSGHKYGRAFVGVGWVIWRDPSYLPSSMIFELHYLGSIEKSFSLNFSRPAAPIIVSYFNFLHLGFEKYRSISLHDARNARLFARALENSKYYKVVSAVHQLKPETTTGVGALVDKVAQVTLKDDKVDEIDRYVPCLPVVAFKFSDEFTKEFPNVEQRWMQTLLRSKGWIIPNYELPPNLETVEILRVVFREQFTEDLVEKLVTDIIEITEGLMKDGGPAHAKATHVAHTAKKHHPDSSHSHHSVGATVPSGPTSIC